MTQIKRYEVQQVLDATYNKQENLPNFMHITSIESENYTVGDDGIVWDDNEMQFIEVDPTLTRVAMIHMIAEALIELSL